MVLLSERSVRVSVWRAGIVSNAALSQSNEKVSPDINGAKTTANLHCSKDSNTYVDKLKIIRGVVAAIATPFEDGVEQIKMYTKHESAK